MRIMGLDYGGRTVGVAMSDPFGWTAQGITVIRRKDEKNLKDTISEIKKIVDEYSVETIVLGFPKNMDNSQGSGCEKALFFKNKLEETLGDINIILQDERLSTVGANRSLLEADVSRGKRKMVIDKMAAVFILQGYLDTKDKQANEFNINKEM